MGAALVQEDEAQARRRRRAASSRRARAPAASGSGWPPTAGSASSSATRPPAAEADRPQRTPTTATSSASQDGSLCLLPFPDDYYTVADREQRDRQAGRPQDRGDARERRRHPHRRRPLQRSTTASAPGRRSCSRSPASTRPAALARDRRGADQPPRARTATQDAPVVVIDAQTGERWPIWVEIDSNATTPEATALEIHPATNFAAGHRYIVALRDLRHADGDAIEAPEGFRYYRDDLPSSRADDQRPAQPLRVDLQDPARRPRSSARSLYLAWDFTVASDENIAGRAAHDARRRLRPARRHDDGRPRAAGRLARRSTITDVENFTAGGGRRDRPPGHRHLRRCPATWCRTARPGGRFAARPGRPADAATATGPANFDCIIPRVAVDGRAEPGPAGRSTATACSAAPARSASGPSRTSPTSTASSSAPPTRSGCRARTSRTRPASSRTSPTSPSSPTASSRACSTSSSSAG